MKHMRRSFLILFMMIALVTLNACGKKDTGNKEKNTLLLILASLNRSASSTSNSDLNYNTSPNDRAVSRTSGVAPLAVHFFSDYVSGDGKSDRFLHYDYTWDFGDAGSGAWGTTGRSKNTAKGATAVHVYESPGEYHVTLTIRNHAGVVGTENYTVVVDNPDSVYSGTNTTCVNKAGDGNFSGAPAGARTVSTDDLSTIVQYATSGSRILFKRGSSWTLASGLSWPSNAGPVTIGAYGTGTNPDALGIYDNAPRITVNGGTFLSMSSKQDWRVMDLCLVDPTRNNNSLNGSTCMQRLLMLRMKIEGFADGIIWNHVNDENLMRKDDIVIASCHVSDSKTHVIYGGSERLALLGNIISDAREYHVVRIWQAYRSVISNNIISGSSYATSNGEHALKLHGPGVYPGGQGTDTLGVPVANTGLKDVRTEYTIVADNIFGSSGPWPVAIGPQNGNADERLSNIIFERNRIHSGYGTQSPRPVTTSLVVWGRYITVRNNIIDGTGSDINYGAMVLGRRGVEPIPTNIEVYHNTIYRGDSANMQRGILVEEPVTNSTIKNNLISFPKATGAVTMIENRSADPNIDISDNLLTSNAMFTNPDLADPLARDFSLQAGSPALGLGTGVPVFDDFFLNSRPASAGDLGACEQ